MTTPEHEPNPWAMNLVVLRDRHHPARRVDAAEAAARAVATLLDDPRATGDGPWAPAVRHWEDARIRKIVRRADGKRWTDVQVVPGVTVVQPSPRPDHGDAAVRALLPGPVDAQDRLVDRLQIAGTHLPDAGPTASHDAVVTIEVNPDVEMTTGKLCAQCGHAAQLALRALQGGGAADARTLERWRTDGFRVRVVVPDPATWRGAHRPVEVVDAGFTEFDRPTPTTRACW